MRETEITCPECFKGKIKTTKDTPDHETNPRTYCGHCGTSFILLSERSVRYGHEEKPHKEGEPIVLNVHGFKEQKRWSGEVPKDLPYLNYQDIPDINNGDKYDWYQVGNDKYGRFMYCPKTNTKRSQTMGEFYGTSPVD